MLEKPQSGIDNVPEKFWIVFCIGISILAIALRYTSLNTHDNAWLLHVSLEFLNGSKLYVDLVEVNPPLIIFLYALPAAMAQFLDVQVHFVFYAYVIALIFLSCALMYTIADNVLLAKRGFAAVLIAVALLVLPRENFGQREHFMVILTLPYIFLIARRIQGLPCAKGFAMLIGLLAVFGFGLKHYFLIIPTMLELFLLFSSRSILKSFRPETMALGGGLLIYLGVIFYVTPAYINQILPMALTVYSQGFSVPFAKVYSSIELVVLVLVSGVMTMMLIEGQKIPALAIALFIAGLGGFIGYVIQAKGWNYQAYPALAFLFISSGLLVAQISSENGWRTTRVVAVASAVLILLTLPILSLMDYRYKNSTVKAWQQVFQQNEPVRSFFVMSTLLSTGFPLANVSGKKWASRFPTLWLLPGITSGGNSGRDDLDAKISEVERYQLNATVDDFTNHKPDIVFVDMRPAMSHFGGASFDFLKFFNKDPRFSALWANYENIGSDRFGFQHYRLKKP